MFEQALLTTRAVSVRATLSTAGSAIILVVVLAFEAFITCPRECNCALVITFAKAADFFFILRVLRHLTNHWESVVFVLLLQVQALSLIVTCRSAGAIHVDLTRSALSAIVTRTRAELTSLVIPIIPSTADAEIHIRLLREVKPVKATEATVGVFGVLVFAVIDCESQMQ